MSYFTVRNEQQKMFTQLPKALLYEKEYKTMSNDSKVLYSFLVDRVSLSLKNNYIDSFGRIYIKCSEISMAEILNKSEKTVRKFKNELIEKDLLEQPDKKDKTKYYVKQPKVTVEKLEDYIADFQEVVKEKVHKELERNKEYRLRKANNKVAILKSQNCNGNNDRSIENTNVEEVATVKSTVMHQSKLPFSNTNFSNTDYSMYVCTGEPVQNEIETPFILLAKDCGITFTSEMKEMVMSYEEVFSYELYEYLFLDILNKYRNGKVTSFEKYLLSALDTQSSKRNFTLADYLEYKRDFSNTNYPRKDYKVPTKKQEPVAPVVEEEPVNVEFVPTFQEVVEEPKTAEVDAPNEDIQDKIARLHFRQANGLKGMEYFNMSMEELQAVVEERKQREMQVETLMNTYNKDLMDEDTRREYAMKALGLI